MKLLVLRLLLKICLPLCLLITVLWLKLNTSCENVSPAAKENSIVVTAFSSPSDSTEENILTEENLHATDNMLLPPAPNVYGKSDASVVNEFFVATGAATLAPAATIPETLGVHHETAFLMTSPTLGVTSVNCNSSVNNSIDRVEGTDEVHEQQELGIHQPSLVIHSDLPKSGSIAHHLRAIVAVSEEGSSGRPPPQQRAMHQTKSVQGLGYGKALLFYIQVILCADGSFGDVEQHGVVHDLAPVSLTTGVVLEEDKGGTVPSITAAASRLVMVISGLASIGNCSNPSYGGFLSGALDDLLNLAQIKQSNMPVGSLSSISMVTSCCLPVTVYTMPSLDDVPSAGGFLLQLGVPEWILFTPNAILLASSGTSNTALCPHPASSTRIPGLSSVQISLAKHCVPHEAGFFCCSWNVLYFVWSLILFYTSVDTSSWAILTLVIIHLLHQL